MPLRINRRIVDQEISRKLKQVERAVAEQLQVIRDAINDDDVLPNLMQAVELVQRFQRLSTDELYDAAMADGLDDLSGAVENCAIALRPMLEAVQNVRYILDHSPSREELELELSGDPIDDPT